VKAEDQPPPDLVSELAQEPAQLKVTVSPLAEPDSVNPTEVPLVYVTEGAVLLFESLAVQTYVVLPVKAADPLSVTVTRPELPDVTPVTPWSTCPAAAPAALNTVLGPAEPAAP
jgi:hypothetical protein